VAWRTGTPGRARPGCHDLAVSPRTSEPGGEFRYHHPIEVRFGDTDALGHVNNATYLSYFEMARSGYYLELMGTPFGTGEPASTWTIFLTEASVTYRAPAYFGERLVADCRVEWASRSLFALQYRVRSEGSTRAPARLIAHGETVQAILDVTTGRVTRIPADLLQRFARFEGHAIPSRPR
jgi:acyl-CoA thioester hydrolase